MYRLIFILTHLIGIVNAQLVIKPSESVIIREKFQSFVAFCYGQQNIRVAAWQTPAQIDVAEDRQSRINVERKPEGFKLRIRNLTDNDQGLWKCIGIDENQKLIFNKFQLIIRTPIVFISEPIQYAELGADVLIKCRIDSTSLVEISWYKGQNRIEVSLPKYKQETNGLNIYQVSLVDNDIFWCQADVTDTSESKDFQIKVIVAQSVSIPTITCAEPCAVEKHTAILTCKSTGMPTVEYLWFYGNDDTHIINATPKFHIRGNLLIINHLDETDNGKYSCLAFNEYDRKGKIASYSLTVIVPPHILPITPIEIILDENSSPKQISFTCQVYRGSDKHLSLNWFYENETLVQSDRENSISVVEMKTERSIKISFDSVQRHHHGNYTCVVKNAADFESQTAQLIIRYKPVVINSIDTVYSAPNYPAIMKCQFDSYPEPIIEWMINGRINNKRQIILNANHSQVIHFFTRKVGPTIYESQLTYNPSEDDFGANFQCQADNSRIAKHSIVLKRAFRPQLARIAEIKPHSNALELIVYPPSQTGGLPLINYIVEYSKINDRNSTQNIFIPVSSNASQTIEINSLRSACSYQIQVAVENYAGRSDFSIPVQAKTYEGQIPKFNVSSTSCVNLTICFIKWFVEHDGGSSISNIQLFHARIPKTGRVNIWSKPIEIEPQKTEYQLTGLKKHANYSILLRLHNAAGFSEQQIQLFIEPKSKCKSGCSNSPSILVTIGIVVIILTGLIAVFVLSIAIRTLFM